MNAFLHIKGQLSSLSRTVVAILLLVVSSSAYSNINKAFFEDGKLSESKIKEFLENVTLRKTEVVKGIVNEYQAHSKGMSRSKAIEKANSKKEVKVFSIIEDELRKLNSTTNKAEQKEIAQNILHLNYALKVSGVRLESIKKVSFIRESMRSWSIPIHNAPEGEAKNLINPETGKYFTEAELSQLKQDGVDLSLYSPEKHTSFRSDIKIEKTDVKKIYRGGSRMYKKVKLKFPKNEGTFKKIRKTQSKPKLDFTNIHDGKKHTYKLKLGSEMHSEITSASLFATLGYYTDISTYVTDFKLKIGNLTFDQFKSDWNSYYKTWNVDDLIKETGSDDNGNFIIFHEGLVELKPKKKLVRVGPWEWGDEDYKKRREVRGILLFNMWVSNLDLKESENNKLILRNSKKKGLQLFNLQHDMGFAFGKRFREKPGAFPWTLVESKTDDYIHMNFNSFQQNSGFGHVTYSDAKWMARLISRLSRKQIEVAVELGGWPNSVDKLLVEKLIARRNQLVEAFELEKEAKSLTSDRQLTTDDGVIQNGVLTKFIFDGYTQDFGHEFAELMQPVVDMMRDFAINGSLFAFKHFNEFKFGGTALDFSDKFVNETTLGVGRKIEINPSPTGNDDLYLVKDTFKVGQRVGGGLVLSGNISYIREYTLVYPVRTKVEGQLNNNFIVNLFLPFHLRKSRMPKKYSVMVEDYLSGNGRLKISDSEILDLGLATSLSMIKLKRIIVSKKHQGEQKILIDRGNSKQLELKLYIKIASILKIPLLKGSVEGGKLVRKIYRIDQSLREEAFAFDKLIHLGNIDYFRDKDYENLLETRYIDKKTKYNFFNLLMLNNLTRSDSIKIEKSIHEDEKTVHQYRNERESGWSMIDNGEKIQSYVHTLAKEKSATELDGIQASVRFFIEDSNTHTYELENYIKLVNDISFDRDIIDFTPSLHTINGLWGHTLTSIDLTFNKKAVAEILNINQENYLDLISKSTGKSAAYWKFLLNYKHDSSKLNPEVVYDLSGEYRISQPDIYFVKHLKSFFISLKQSLKESKLQDKVDLIGEAIRRLIYKSGITYKTELISSLLQYLDEKDYRLNGLIRVPGNKELKFPARTPLTGRKGNQYISHDLPLMYFSFEDPSELYNINGF